MIHHNGNETEIIRKKRKLASFFVLCHEALQKHKTETPPSFRFSVINLKKGTIYLFFPRFALKASLRAERTQRQMEERPQRGLMCLTRSWRGERRARRLFPPHPQHPHRHPPAQHRHAGSAEEVWVPILRHHLSARRCRAPGVSEGHDIGDGACTMLLCHFRKSSKFHSNNAINCYFMFKFY